LLIGILFEDILFEGFFRLLGQLGRGAQGEKVELPGLDSPLYLVIGDAAENFPAQPVELVSEQADLLLIAAYLLLVAAYLIGKQGNLLLVVTGLL
jgi:hypothetical protein